MSKLLADILELDRESKEALLLASTTYRSGPDSCNSLYMGGMAHHTLRLILEGQERPYEESIADASEMQLDRAIAYNWNIIRYMMEHPMRKCPCCNQILPAKEE